MPAVPLLYLWGDDDLAAERIIDRLADHLATDTGAPVERWAARGEMATASSTLADLGERVATQVLFGGGTLAVVRNLGPLVRTTAGREAVLAAVSRLAPGNALVFADIGKSGLREAPQKRVAAAVTEAGGAVIKVEAPKAGGLAGWIETEARERGLALGSGAAKELAARVGGFVGQNDADRGFQTRTASGELDKLAIYRAENPITVEDVRALVAEAVPGSVWAFVDAVAERRADRSLELLERLLPTMPEPVLVVVLHRRIRELLELADRLAGGEALATAARAMGIASSYRADTLAGQARRWTLPELTDALAGLLELDARIKGAVGTSGDAAQKRLAVTLWVIDHAGGRSGRPLA